MTKELIKVRDLKAHDPLRKKILAKIYEWARETGSVHGHALRAQDEFGVLLNESQLHRWRRNDFKSAQERCDSERNAFMEDIANDLRDQLDDLRAILMADPFDYKARDQLLHYMERASKMFGLDKPAGLQVEVSTPPPVFEMSGVVPSAQLLSDGDSGN